MADTAGGLGMSVEYEFDLSAKTAIGQARIRHALNEINAGMARRFVDVTAENVPVDSGMAAASLIPLANRAGIDISMDIARRIKEKSSSTAYSGDPESDRKRSMEWGNELGREAFKFQTMSPTGAFFDTAWFEFNINIHHWEHFGHGWGQAATEAGREAAERYWEQNETRFRAIAGEWYT